MQQQQQHSIFDWSRIECSKGLKEVVPGAYLHQFEQLYSTSMTANQLHAHAAHILRFSAAAACENNNIHHHPSSSVVIESGRSLQQQDTPLAAAAAAVVACSTTTGGGDGHHGWSTTDVCAAANHHHDSSRVATPASSGGGNKRKRRPAGTPDPDAEVVALSPETLMESDRYVCEICNQGFQRDQNLQMHRRRHKVPWKLLKKASLITHKRVYVCPELTCLHHDPSHALGDLVGIKKHFRRKHCNEKQWVCDKCSKGYAVQSDYKAHLKTCGTRGHCCDCGRVFSRVESFIEHQDMCNAAEVQKLAGSMQRGENEKQHLRKSSTTLQHMSSPIITAGRRNIQSSCNEESPSQSSDTTAAPFAHSGISDNTAASADSSRLNEQVISTKTFDSNSHEVDAVSTAVVAGPTSWVHHERRRCNELQQLLPSATQALHERLESNSESALQASSTPHDKRLLEAVSSTSRRSHAETTRGFISSALCPDMSFSADCKSLTPTCCRSMDDVVNTPPSLQLTIGPYSKESAEVNISNDRGSNYVNALQAAGSTDRKASLDAGADHRLNVVGAMSNYQQLQQDRPVAAGEAMPVVRSGCNKGIGEDLALSFPAATAASVLQPAAAVRNEVLVISEEAAAGNVTKAVTMSVKEFRTSQRSRLPVLRDDSIRTTGTRTQELAINAFNQQESSAAPPRSSSYPPVIIKTSRSANSSLQYTPSYADHGSGLKSQVVDLERTSLESETAAVREDMIWAAQRTSNIVQLQPPPQAAQRSTPEPAADNHPGGGPTQYDKHARGQPRGIFQSEFLIVPRAVERTGSAASRQNELGATAACAEANKARLEQVPHQAEPSSEARTEMNSAWLDLAAARRTKEQARLESTEAQNEIARAEVLKREARERIQQASAEKAYADHARDVAKRQMDMAEAELADAKRMRERAQAEIDTSRLILKEQSDQCSSVDAAIIRASPRDHQTLRGSCCSYVCQVCCKSDQPVGRDLSLGLQQTTTHKSIPVQPGFVSSHWPGTKTDHKILRLQNASNEIGNRAAAAAGLVNYLTVRENTFEGVASAKYGDNDHNPSTRLLSHMIGESSAACRRWSAASLAGVAAAGRDGRCSPGLLAANSIPATFATNMSCTIEATGGVNPRTSTDHHSQSGS